MLSFDLWGEGVRHNLLDMLRVCYICNKGVTRMLQRCYKSVTKVLRGCMIFGVRGSGTTCFVILMLNYYEGVTRVLQGCYRSVTSVIP
jgi:hypothetical protein